METSYRFGDRVEVFLDASRAKSAGWYAGAIVRIDPYSGKRSFYWVEFDAEAQALLGFRSISVFNPKNIRKIES